MSARRVVALVCACLVVTLVFQAPLSAASPPSDPSYANYAAASSEGNALASSMEAGYEPSKAIDQNGGTAWRATAIGDLVIDFNEAKDLREVHIDLADYAMPSMELYYKRGDGGYSFLTSWAGNTAFTLTHALAGGVIAYGIKVGFPWPLTHTHSYNHPHQECEWRDDGWGEYRYCETVNHVHYYNEDHHAHVAEVEAWGLPVGQADDGLDDGYETRWWYRQTAALAGSLTIPNTGSDVLVVPLERPTWAGVDTRAFLSLEVQHSALGDLAIAVGYMTGSGWDDQFVWIPGGYANASIWDTSPASHAQTICEEWEWRDDGAGEYRVCVRYGTVNVVDYYAAVPVVRGASTIYLAVTESPTTSASGATGDVSRVTIDLMKSGLEVWEQDAGFRTPGFWRPELQGYPIWRLLVRDWQPYGPAGTLLSAAVITEERSDNARADTDYDGLLDGDDVALGTYPVAADTDWDGLTDLFERDPQPLTWTVDGQTLMRTLKTSPSLADSDGDRLNDGEERSLGFDLTITDPTTGDTDGDGLRDGDEVFVHGSNATRSDTDGDTFSDSLEVAPRFLALTVNGGAETRPVTTLPYTADSDGDGLRDDDEWYGTSSHGVKTDPSDWDTDGDGLGDDEVWTAFAIRGLPQLEAVLTAIETRQPLKYWEPAIHGYITLYAEYGVTSNPLSSDTDGDGLSDWAESFLHSDPRNDDTDQDRIPDGIDDDPTVVEIERALIHVDQEWCCEILVGGTQRYRITYSVSDAAGIQEVFVYKDGNYGSPVHIHAVGGASSVQFTDHFDVESWELDGARWEIAVRDLNGNFGYITLEKPYGFDTPANFLRSATRIYLGPQNGGMLSGAWSALRDTVVDLATLFLNTGAILDGGRAIADAFTSQGVDGLVGVAKALYAYIDESQEEANPYPNGTDDHASFRFHWYAGYIAATVGLSIVGAIGAKVVVEGLLATRVFTEISRHLADFADATKVAQWMARLKGLGALNSRVLIGAVFTTAFAGAAYVWPEIFGEWFANYLGGAFVFVSLYSLAPLGLADDVLRKAAKVVKLAGLDNADRAITALFNRVGKETTEEVIRGLHALHKASVKGVDGVEGLAYRILKNALTGGDVSGPIYELRVAIRYGIENVQAVGVSFGPKVARTGDLDVLLKDGRIVEAKSGNLATANVGSKAYDDFVEDMKRKVKAWESWRSESGVKGTNTVSFQSLPHQDILDWLTQHRVNWEIQP